MGQGKARARTSMAAAGPARAAPPEQAVIAYPHPGTVRAEFMRSMLALARHCGEQVAGIIDVHAGPNLSRWRNAIVERFLSYDVPWLLMVDTDMVFAPDMLARLVAAADWAERPILGALCYSENEDGEPYSTMYELVEEQGQPSSPGTRPGRRTPPTGSPPPEPGACWCTGACSRPSPDTSPIRSRRGFVRSPSAAGSWARI
jgi:hypothetical protein